MKEDEQAERLGDILSILYEFNWAMSETEMMQHSTKVSDVEDLRSRLIDLKKADLVADAVPGMWKQTKKGRELVRQSLKPGG